MINIFSGLRARIYSCCDILSNGKADCGDFKEEYRRYGLRRVAFVVVCTAVAILSVGLSIYVGATSIDFIHIYEILFDHVSGVDFPKGSSDFIDDRIIWNNRLPRALFALIAGAGLAAAGACMQSVMKNPLADPYTTGISSGACFGAAVGMILGFSLSSAISGLGTVINAFVFSIIPMMFILALAPRVSSSPATLILAGTAVSYIFSALTTVLMMMTDDETLAAVYRWQVGSLSEINWTSVDVVAPICVVGAMVLIFLSGKLNLLSMGDDNAKSLGLDAQTLRMICLVIVSFMAASVVSFAGIIGFIGLVSPHIVRMMIGSDNRYVIPASAAFGGLFLILSDIIVRWIAPFDTIPVGVVVSFIGAPIFLILIIRQKRAVW